MNKFIRNSVFVLCAGLVGCQSLPQNHQNEINRIKAQQIATQDDSLHLDLAKQYLKIADETRSFEYVYKAIEELETFSEKAPDHLVAQVLRYRLYYDLAVNGDVIAMNKLSLLFEDLPEHVVKNLNPPHFAKAVLKVRTEGLRDKAGIRKYLKQGITEQPYSVSSHVMLANIYAEDKRYKLAIPLMDKITKLKPKDAYAAKKYADLLMDSVEDNCLYTSEDPYKQALVQLRKAKKLKPDDPDIELGFVRIYGNMGRYILSLNAAKKFDELEGTVDSKTEVIAAYIDFGKMDLAGELIENHLKSGDVSPYFYQQSAKYFALKRDWERSSAMWKEFFNSTDGHGIFDALSYSYVDEKLHGKEIAMKTFSQHSQTFYGNWESQLKAYRLGEISKSELYLKTQNTCDMTEANFVIAMELIASGKDIESKKYLQEIVNDKAYGYVEYKAAKYLIETL